MFIQSGKILFLLSLSWVSKKNIQKYIKKINKRISELTSNQMVNLSSSTNLIMLQYPSPILI